MHLIRNRNVARRRKADAADVNEIPNTFIVVLLLLLLWAQREFYD